MYAPPPPEGGKEDVEVSLWIRESWQACKNIHPVRNIKSDLQMIFNSVHQRGEVLLQCTRGVDDDDITTLTAVIASDIMVR